jgi:hypothetical protein
MSAATILRAKLKRLQCHMRRVAYDLDRLAAAPDSELAAHAQELRGAAELIDMWRARVTQEVQS